MSVRLLCVIAHNIIIEGWPAAATSLLLISTGPIRNGHPRNPPGKTSTQSPFLFPFMVLPDRSQGKPGWRRGIVVSMVGVINDVNQRQAQLILRVLDG